MMRRREGGGAVDKLLVATLVQPVGLMEPSHSTADHQRQL